MRSSFAGYYRPTEEEFSKLWQECLFVFDANVILNLYRYSPETRGEMLRLLENLSSRIWMPYQAALEYQRNRLEVVAEQSSVCQKIRKQISDLRESLGSGRQHPHIENIENVKQTLTNLEDEIRDKAEQQEKLFNDDDIMRQVAELFDGRVGEDFCEKETKGDL